MTTKPKEQSVKIILPNILGHERIAMASSATYARMHGFSSARIEDLKTIVAEAATNAMQHGNKGREDTDVVVTMGFKDNAIYVKVSDQGDGIAEVLPKPDIERIMNKQDPPTGFGVFLIRELADEVEYVLDSKSGHSLNIVVKNNTG